MCREKNVVQKWTGSMIDSMGLSDLFEIFFVVSLDQSLATIIPKVTSFLEFEKLQSTIILLLKSFN